MPPGARAGLKRGDIVLKLNGEGVDDANALRNRISQMAPNTPDGWKSGATERLRM